MASRRPSSSPSRRAWPCSETDIRPSSRSMRCSTATTRSSSRSMRCSKAVIRVSKAATRLSIRSRRVSTRSIRASRRSNCLNMQLESRYTKRGKGNSNTEDCYKFRRHNLPRSLERPSKLVHRLRLDRIPLFTVSMIGTMVPRHRQTRKPSRDYSHALMGAVAGERVRIRGVSQ